MNPFDVMSDVFKQLLAKNFVSGLIIYLFAIWLPINLFLPGYWTQLYEPTTIVIIAFVIGLLFNYFGLHGKADKVGIKVHLIDREKCNIDILIANSFKINTSCMPPKTTNEISKQILDIFIKTYKPNIYFSIEDARIEPRLIMTIAFSLFFFLVSSLICLISSLIYTIITLKSMSSSFVVSATNVLTFFEGIFPEPTVRPICGIISIIICLVGRRVVNDKVIKIYIRLNRFTASMIKRAYYEIKREYPKILNDFLKEIEKSDDTNKGGTGDQRECKEDIG